MLCTDISMLSSLTRGTDGEHLEDNDIPLDPRDWTRQDVTHWLTLLALKHQINVHPERFPMNGKGLTILTRDMICDRVPGVDGGQVHDELHSRLQKAIEEQMKRLQEMDSLLRTGLMNQ